MVGILLRILLRRRLGRDPVYDGEGPRPEVSRGQGSCFLKGLRGKEGDEGTSPPLPPDTSGRDPPPSSSPPIWPRPLSPHPPHTHHSSLFRSPVISLSFSSLHNIPFDVQFCFSS